VPRYGPDRKLFLPGGFLDPAEVPDYLDGTLAGECVPGATHPTLDWAGLPARAAVEGVR